MMTLEQLKNKDVYTMDDLCEIMKYLRVGCPWDKEQTHESIRICFIEEVYEVCDAIDKKDPDLMCEELGDVLLQVVFHAQMAEEDGEFTLSDAVDGICRKLIIRHPHVFGDVKAETSGDVLYNWDKIKADTKGQKTVADTVRDVPKSLPGLMRAQKTAKRAAKGNSYKLEENMLTEDALGEALFRLCSAAQYSGIDAEEALSRYCDRFVADFE